MASKQCLPIFIGLLLETLENTCRDPIATRRHGHRRPVVGWGSFVVSHIHSGEEFFQHQAVAVPSQLSFNKSGPSMSFLCRLKKNSLMAKVLMQN